MCIKLVHYCLEIFCNYIILANSTRWKKNQIYKKKKCRQTQSTK